MRLADTVALVTGGGSGIGRAICQLFAREGASVVAADIRLARAEETAKLVGDAGGTALAIEVDVADAASVEAMAAKALAEYGRVDVLVNNAGVSIGDDILTISEETWDTNLNIVLKSVFLCSKALLPQMLARRKGAIVNIASVNGLTGIGEEPYSAAKAGMINLTQNMAVKYGPSGVRVNVIAPGTIRTPIWAARVEQDPQVFDKLSAWYPLGRVGEAEDIAKAALFLASDDAAWITGTTLTVDGGLLAGLFRLSQDLSLET